MQTISLLALLLGSAPDVESAGLLTELVTNALGKEPTLDVISGADMRRQLELEADKQVLGCALEKSCLAEIANAMGARFVVYGKLGRLDDVAILTLNLFDSEKAQAVGRVVIKDKALSALGDKVDGAVVDLTSRLLVQLDRAHPARVLVLDVEASGAGDASPASPASAPVPAAASTTPLSAMFWGGIGGLVGGTRIGGVGVWLLTGAIRLDQAADNLETPIAEAERKYDERDLSGGAGLGALGLGAALVVTGGGLLGWELLAAPDEEPAMTDTLAATAASPAAAQAK